MKTILIFAICSLCLWFCKAANKKQKKKIESLSSLVMDTVDYQAQIQPILQDKCSPCHFPGGKMYEKLPFDKGETIIKHEAGILKRIKDDQKVALIKQYINQRLK